MIQVLKASRETPELRVLLALKASKDRKVILVPPVLPELKVSKALKEIQAQLARLVPPVLPAFKVPKVTLVPLALPVFRVPKGILGLQEQLALQVSRGQKVTLVLKVPRVTLVPLEPLVLRAFRESKGQPVPPAPKARRVTKESKV